MKQIESGPIKAGVKLTIVHRACTVVAKEGGVEALQIARSRGWAVQ